jgi:hypothetical protein
LLCLQWGDTPLFPEMAFTVIFLLVTLLSWTAANLLEFDVDSEAASAKPQLYFIAQGSPSRIHRMSADGGNVETVVSELRHQPDGIAVSKELGYIYFSNMSPGSIQRVRLDGSNLTTLVRGFEVGKQLAMVKEKLYWTDREGMKVMRCNLNGSNVEVLVDTSRDECTASECKFAVGIAVDTLNGFVYWSQKSKGGFGSIHRAPTTFRPGQTAANRNDVQTVLKNLPEPIDLQWVDDFGLFWMDRGHQSGGNSVNRMRMSLETMRGVARFPERSPPIVTGLTEGIGIAVDRVSRRIWFTDLGGHVYRSDMDGSHLTELKNHLGYLVGIDYVS